MFYEGPICMCDFTYQPKEHTRVFLHVGAANYKSWFWVNGQKVCEHEGGYTSFNCEVTEAVHAGDPSSMPKAQEPQLPKVSGDLACVLE